MPQLPESRVESIAGTVYPMGCTQMGTGVVSSATGLLSIPTGAQMVLVSPESQGVRWRDDGTSPTDSVGMPIAAGDSLLYTGDLSAFKLIEMSASAKINLAYYR